MHPAKKSDSDKHRRQGLRPHTEYSGRADSDRQYTSGTLIGDDSLLRQWEVLYYIRVSNTP